MRAQLPERANREGTGAGRPPLVLKLLGNFPVVDLNETIALIVRAHKDLLPVQSNAVEALAALDAEKYDFHRLTFPERDPIRTPASSPSTISNFRADTFRTVDLAERNH